MGVIQEFEKQIAYRGWQTPQLPRPEKAQHQKKNRGYDKNPGLVSSNILSPRFVSNLGLWYKEEQYDTANTLAGLVSENAQVWRKPIRDTRKKQPKKLWLTRAQRKICKWVVGSLCVYSMSCNDQLTCWVTRLVLHFEHKFHGFSLKNEPRNAKIY